MAVNTGSTPSAEARELGAGLRRLREGRGLSTRALADMSGQSAANFSHWESGGRLPSEERLTAVLDALDVQEDERARLVGLRQKANGPGQLVSGAPSIGARLAQLIQYEQVSSKITEGALALIPGLLQTSAYARATLGGLSDVDTRVALRMGRSEVLTRAAAPVEYAAYIDSEALVRPVGPPDVMAGQLRHLLQMAKRPNVTIHIVPSTRTGYDALLVGSFIVIEFPTASPIVHVEQHTASGFLWDEDSIAAYSTAIEKIDSKAMTPARSAEVIAEIVRGMESA